MSSSRDRHRDHHSSSQRSSHRDHHEKSSGSSHHRHHSSSSSSSTHRQHNQSKHSSDKDQDKDSIDRHQRDRLDEQLRRSEQDRTKRLAAGRSERRDVSELAKKLRLDPDRDGDVVMDKIREKSRREYLKSRAAKQLEIVEEDLKDEKDLFQDVNLTKREREHIRYKERVVDLAKSQLEASANLKKKQYFLPDSQPEYVEVDEDDKEFNSGEKKWEKTKIEEANLNNRAKKYDDADKFDELSDLDLIMQDKEFIERVRRGDKFEGEYLDPKEIERKAKESARREMKEQRRRLPVYERKDELLQAIEENQIIIVQGETGCGKTTQIPQYLHENGYTKVDMIEMENEHDPSRKYHKMQATKIVGCTQPRRVAAMSVAARVAQEVGCRLGDTVGYSIRFEDRTTDETVIKYMTDGMLLREFLIDPKLEKYSVMIVDEAHERTLHTDILLTLLKDVTRARSDFKLIISSATLDEQKFSHFFDEPPVFKIKGRLFQVDTVHMKAEQEGGTSSTIALCLRTLMQIHRTYEDKDGDILVFLSGQDEIEELHQELEAVVKSLGKKVKRELIIRPIYANLPTDQQTRVFDPTPPNARKVVIATNIAETSLTIDGIVFVIDSGYCKQNRFSSKTGMETLAKTRISKASADQRAGRAGRNRPGKCFRLYSKEEYQTEFEENTQPEIQRLNLANVVLLLKMMNINDVINFEYVDKPPMEMLLASIEQLTALGALDKAGELTLLGRRMAEFPLEPRMSKAIIGSESFKCSEEVLTIMSMLSVNGSIFYKPKDKAVHAEASRKSFYSITGDHLMLLKVYNDWAASDYSKQWCYEKFVQHKSMSRARDVREQLEKLCENVEVKLISDLEDTIKIRKAILSGFFQNVARVSREGGSYRTIKHNQSVHIHPTSALFDYKPRWVVFNELKETSKEYMRTISEIEPMWLVEVAPFFYNKEEILEMSKKKMPYQNRGKSRAELNPTYG